VHVIAGGCDDVVLRFADAMLTQDTVDDFSRAAAPVLHLQTGLGFKGFLERIGSERFHRSIKEDLAAFLFGGLNQLSCLRPRTLTEKNRQQSD